MSAMLNPCRAGGDAYLRESVKNSQRRVSFSSIRIIEFPYAVGYTPCNSGVPIGAGSEAQFEVAFQLDHFESSRPPRRSKEALHLTAADRKAILLRHGFSAGEISAATKAATSIRKQRAETLRELRTTVQTLTLKISPSDPSTTNSKTGTSTTATTERTSHSYCPSPVPPSPLRPSHRSHESSSQAEDILRRRWRQRRLSQTTSPMPLQILKQSGTNIREQSLSPLRTKTKLSRRRVRAPIQENLFDPAASPTDITKNFGQNCAPGNIEVAESESLFCTSLSVGPDRTGCFINKPVEKENERKIVFAMSSQRNRQTPVKRGWGTMSEGMDRPMVMPQRCLTPPQPKSHIYARRM
ncbi:hypothetical protein IV203_018161 [Nitzschia inconspicua]|uniref:Uncharacterized protein n=1 Tax=Nitzschia inconspicua TaxID=303405 RepID=A0A9K3M1M6_9STRA|nr:hypothetical protein IV203_018161 [Nitzschia inconspicua]